MVNLKAGPPESSALIVFPPSTAQKWVLPNGLTVIVQEDHSAPVASVQAWCATGSIDEDQHLGAGVFGKTEQDSIQDFKNVYDFEEAFVKPFAPAKPETVKAPAQLPPSKPATSRK